MKIKLSHEVNARMKALVALCDTEINGLGKVMVENDGETLRVVDIAVLKQRVSGVHADMDKEDLMRFFEERREVGDAGDWKLQWHSHVNMATFWSTTDETAIENIGATADWLVSIVRNKQDSCLGRVDIFRPKRLVFDNIPVEVATDDDLFRAWAQQQIDDNVTVQRIFTPTVPSTPSAGGDTIVGKIFHLGNHRRPEEADADSAADTHSNFHSYSDEEIAELLEMEEEYDPETGMWYPPAGQPIPLANAARYYKNRQRFNRFVDEATKETQEEDQATPGDGETSGSGSATPAPKPGKLANRRTKKKEEE